MDEYVSRFLLLAPDSLEDLGAMVFLVISLSSYSWACCRKAPITRSFAPIVFPTPYRGE